MRKRIRGFFALQAIVLLLSLGSSLVLWLHANRDGSAFARFASVIAYFGLSLIFFKAWVTTRKSSPFQNRWAIAASCISLGGGSYFFWVAHSSVGLTCRGLITIILGVVGLLIFAQGPNWRQGFAKAAEATAMDAGGPAE